MEDECSGDVTEIYRVSLVLKDYTSRAVVQTKIGNSPHMPLDPHMIAAEHLHSVLSK